MQKLNKDQKDSSLLIFIKVSVATIGCILLFFALNMLGGILMTYTSLSEDFYPAISIIITALISILLSLILTQLIQMKGILCSVIAFLILTLFRVVLTLIMKEDISLSTAGVVNLVFCFIFSLVGGVVGVNIKK